MSRYKLTLEYDGTEFVGWQWQTNGFSVQQALEEAVTAFCGETVRVHGAGGPDAASVAGRLEDATSGAVML